MRRHAKVIRLDKGLIISYNVIMNNLDVLRATWISELQDRSHYSTSKNMEDIIEHVDSMVSQMSEEEAAALL